MNEIDSKKARRKFVKVYINFVCFSLILVSAAVAVSSTLNLPGVVQIFYYGLCFIYLFCALSCFNSLSLYCFSTLLVCVCFAIETLLIFFVGLVTQNQEVIQSGAGLGLPPILGWPIALVGGGLAIIFFYRLWSKIDFDWYFNQTFAAKNYDLENKIYFIDWPNDEPDLKLSFFDKKNENGLSKGDILMGIIIIFFPFLTHASFITIMSQYHPFTLIRILFYLSLPLFLFFGYLTLSMYVRYRSYKRIQQELGVKLKPAIFKVK